MELTADEQEASQAFLSAYDVLTLAPLGLRPKGRPAASAGVGDQRTCAWRHDDTGRTICT